ncbi:hypothetical protein VE01_07884 [Pseudogymnoascus verrucosus]|uniref:Uncharacterized protein n=1 Tax=Pseudogymnoascus verrucosus TaxID=342668 RepID=A0A1B8GFK7_9PEZI|nr:uncharacterized protein VE01_07884 [Pseudogymnoascus verrucosus]OBT94593.1 hypothetical protein VE01_07884 [Pseudogymnoascus verrucosus]
MKIVAILSLVSVVSAYILGPGGIDLAPFASAAKDAVGDKIDESKHDGKAEAHKQQI